MHRLSAVSIVVLVSLTSLLAQQGLPKSATFDARRYPPNKFQVSQKEIPLGASSVRVIQAKGRGFTGTPTYCSAWIEVKRDGQIVRRLSYADIEPVGFSYGLFLPLRQPLADALVIMKEGDYDGRMILVSGDGKVADLPGGLYFATEDKRYLVGLHMRDDSGLVVVDSATRSVILDDTALKDEGEIGDFFRDEKGYFFMLLSDSEQPLGFVERIDLTHHRLIKEAGKGHVGAKKVKFDFSPQGMPDCTTK
jgi:hypothetical protein